MDDFSVEKIKEIIASHSPRTDFPAENLRQASVLAPFFPTPGGLSLIFTKRTASLVQHSGQISFPGGMQDPGDPDLETTALRETYEEIGVKPEDVDIWGRLSEEMTITRFSVAPYVGLIPYPYEFVISPAEVDRLIIVPLATLLRPDTFSYDFFDWEGRRFKTYQYTYNSDVIWGATARIVHNLLTLLTTGQEPEDHPLLK